MRPLKRGVRGDRLEGRLERPEPHEDQLGRRDRRLEHGLRENLEPPVALEPAVIEDDLGTGRDARRGPQVVGTRLGQQRLWRRVPDDDGVGTAVPPVQLARDRLVDRDDAGDLRDPPPLEGREDAPDPRGLAGRVARLDEQLVAVVDDRGGTALATASAIAAGRAVRSWPWWTSATGAAAAAVAAHPRTDRRHQASRSIPSSSACGLTRTPASDVADRLTVAYGSAAIAARTIEAAPVPPSGCRRGRAAPPRHRAGSLATGSSACPASGAANRATGTGRSGCRRGSPMPAGPSRSGAAP